MRRKRMHLAIAAVLGAAAALAGCGRPGSGDGGGSGGGKMLTRPEAEQAVMDIPEVAAWADRVANRPFSRDRAVCEAEHTPADAPIAGRRVWILVFGEARRGQLRPWHRFKVDAATGEVWIWQTDTDGYVPAAEWLKQLAIQRGRPVPEE